MKIELVTTLKRQATKILAELHDSKELVFITEHGKLYSDPNGMADTRYYSSLYIEGKYSQTLAENTK